jgi:two-component system, LuxR family, response regulator FixJ
MTTPTVFVVEDDPALRKSLRTLLDAAGLHTETYASGREFLDVVDPGRPGCLVLDLCLGGENGLDLLERLQARSQRPPTIVLTAHGTVPTSVQALHAGAMDVLEKPARPAMLLARIREALELDQRQREQRVLRTAVEERATRLSNREREVAALVVAGKRSKQIAAQLGISVRTVEGYRARLLRKMQASSAAELIAILIRSGVILRT